MCQSGDRHISRQSSGSWRNMLGEQEDTRKIYLYKGSDAVKVFKTIQIDIFLRCMI